MTIPNRVIASQFFYATKKNKAKGVDASSLIATSYGHNIVKKIIDPMNKKIEKVLKRFKKRVNKNAEVENALPDDIIGELMATLRNLDELAKSVAATFALDNEAYHRQAFVRDINQAIGVDVRILLSKKKTKKLIRLSVKENVALIKDIPKKQMKQIRDAIFLNLEKGNDYNSLLKDLSEIEGMTKRRANLIAVDQNGKLNAAFNNARQDDIGVKHFFWRTKGDARVRDEHKNFRNKRYLLSKGAPGGDFPGKKVRCRCRQEPDLRAIQRKALKAA